jgi:hypothetical protein
MNLITEIVRKHLILEKRIATIKANITISYDVKTDSHAKDRQKERNISRGDIILQLEKAKNEITTKIVTGELEDEDIFIVRSRSSNLFIPVILFKETDYMFDITIMSVYRKEADGRPQHTIWVD